MTEAERTRKRAYQLRERGLSWPAVGEKLNTTADAARSAARRYKCEIPHGKSPERTLKLAEAEAMMADKLGLSRPEFQALLASARGQKPPIEVPTAHFAPEPASDPFKALVISDTHIGQKKFHYPLWEEVVRRSREVDIVLHPGDHLEGMSGRPGHVYELNQIGYAQQKAECIRLYKQIEKPIYGIDGNHDQWFKQRGDAGAIVGEDLDAALPHYHHLGEWEGDLEHNGVRIKLFHSGDGTAYAHSYKLQKLVESFTSGEKPHLVLSGHYHKALYQCSRNVHGFECGTICGQTRWMRAKKIQAHLGFWVLEVTPSIGGGIYSIKQEFIPGFEA